MKRGFTMIEMLVVVTVIGILLATGAVSYSTLTRTSRDARRKTDLEQIRAAIEMYRSSEPTLNGQYPTFATANCSGLSALTNFSSYLPTIPADPKSGFNYMCTSSSASYTIYSVLEAVASPTCGVNCGTSIVCEYAVGPYGKTCGP